MDTLVGLRGSRGPEAVVEQEVDGAAVGGAAPRAGAPVRIGLIGDVHAEHGGLAEALAELRARDVDAILCTGDVADGPGCLDRSVALLAEADVRTVAGNHERWLLQDRCRHVAHAHRIRKLSSDTRAWLEGLPAVREIATARGRLMLCHGVGANDMRKVWPGTPERPDGPVHRAPELDAIARAGKFRLLVQGHLHYRTVLDFPGLTLLNAGTLRSGQRPGVCIVDLGADRVRALEPGAGSRGRWGEVACAPLLAHDRHVWPDTGAFRGDRIPCTLYGRPRGRSAADRRAA